MPAAAFKASLGNNFNNVSGTTLAITTTAAIAIGDFVVVRWAADNLSATTPTATCADGGNTYTVQRQAAANATAAAGIAGGMLTSLATVARPSGSTITLTFSGAIVGKAAYAESFTNVVNSTRVAAVGSSATTGAAATSGASAAGIVAGDLVLGFSAVQTRAASTGDTDTVNGSWSTKVTVNGGATSGGDATSVQINGQYKIATAAGAQTFDNTVTSTYWITGLVVMQQAPDPSITQASYRLYADGTEAGSVALAAQDTSYTADVTAGDANLLVRTRLQSTTAVAVLATDDFQLQWEKNASGTWFNVGETVADSYNETNIAGGVNQPAAGDVVGQSFTGNGQSLLRCGFYGYQGASPTGTVTATLWAHSGTFGTSSVGTGTALATSAAINASSLSTFGTFGWYYLTFDGTFTLVNGTKYVITVGGTASNSFGAGGDNTAPTHAGNLVTRTSGAWAADNTNDLIFTILTGNIVAFDSASLTDGAATTNRLGAGTGSFVAGKVSEDGLVDDLGWTANNYTELLYTVTLKSAALVNSDVLRFRVLRNAAIAGMTYTQTPTINVTKTVAGGRPKVYLAGAFTKKPLKVWTGAAWVEKPIKVWTGSAWKTLT